MPENVRPLAVPPRPAMQRLLQAWARHAGLRAAQTRVGRVRPCEDQVPVIGMRHLNALVAPAPIEHAFAPMHLEGGAVPQYAIKNWREWTRWKEKRRTRAVGKKSTGRHFKG